jgi:hypothetical protein
VGVSCSGGGRWRAAQVLLAALAAATFAAWVALLLDQFAPPAALAAGGVAAALAWRLSRPRPVLLRWDGQRWTVDGTPAEVAVMLDLGNWLLLRCRPEGGRPRWLPVPCLWSVWRRG